MNRVWYCGLNAAIAAVLAFVPAFSVRNNYALAVNGTEENVQLDTSRNSGYAPEVVVGLSDSNSTSTAEADAGLSQPASEGDTEPVASGSETMREQSESQLSEAKLGEGQSATGRVSTAKCAYRIIISSLGIENCIQDQAAHNLSTPSKASALVANISVGSSRFIYGHNSKNIFGDLGEVKDGAIVQVITPSKTEKYRVNLAESSKSFDYRCLTAANTNSLAGIKNYRSANCSKLISMASLVYGSADHLRLMTCSGSYNKSLKTYDHRHIIYAEKI